MTPDKELYNKPIPNQTISGDNPIVGEPLVDARVSPQPPAAAPAAGDRPRPLPTATVKEDMYALGLKRGDICAMRQPDGKKLPAQVLDAHTVRLLCGSNTTRKHRRTLLKQARNTVANAKASP